MITHQPIEDAMLGAFEADCAQLDTNTSDNKAALVMMKYLGQAIARVRRAEGALTEAEAHVVSLSRHGELAGYGYEIHGALEAIAKGRGGK